MNKFENIPSGVKKGKKEKIKDKESDTKKKNENEKKEKKGKEFKLNKTEKIDNPEKPSKKKSVNGLMIGKVAYNTFTSIVGVKFVSDLGAAMFKQGDIYNYFKQKKEVKKEKKEISGSLKEITDAWEKRRTAQAEHTWEKKQNKELQDAISSFKNKIATTESLNDKEKKEFKKVIASIVSERSNKQEKIKKKKEEESKKVLGTYLQTKIKATRIAKDALNTALTASGLMSLRLAMYGGMALTERAQKANIEFSKKELSNKIKENKDQKSRVLHIIKDITVKASIETGRALAGQGKEKGSKHKLMDFVQALGTVLRGIGIGDAAISEIANQGISGAIDDSLDSFEGQSIVGVLGVMKDNFADRFDRLIHIFGRNNEEASVDTSQESSDTDEYYQANNWRDDLNNEDTSSPPPYMLAKEDGESITDTPEGFVTQNHLEYQGENSIWNEIKAQIPKRKFLLQELAKIGDNTGATETHMIDFLKDQVFENPEEFGLPEDIDIDEITTSQMETMDWDKVFSVLKTKEGLSDALPNLSEEAKESIIDNNKILNELVNKTGSPIDSEVQPEVLAEIKEAGGVDEFLNNSKVTPVDLMGKSIDEQLQPEALETTGEAEGEEVIESHGKEQTFPPVQEEFQSVLPKATEEIEGGDVGGAEVFLKEEQVASPVDDKNILYYKNQYEGNNDLFGVAKEEASEQAAGLLIHNVSQEQLNQYPEVKNVVEQIYLDKLRESLNSFNFLGFGGPSSEELSTEIAGLAYSTGQIQEEQSDLFSQFISQGDEINEGMVKQFIDSNGSWDKEIFSDKINEFVKELENKELPIGEEFVPRSLDAGGNESILVLTRKIPDSDKYEYILQNGTKIETTTEYLEDLLKIPNKSLEK